MQGDKGDGGPNAALMTVGVVGSLLRGHPLSEVCQALLRLDLMRPFLLLVDSLFLLLHLPNTLVVRLCGYWEAK